MITDAWSIVTPEIKAYCKLIAGNELTKYREDQKAFKERYGEAAYERQTKKRKKRKSTNERGKKLRYDDAVEDYSDDDVLKKDVDSAAAQKEDEIAAQEVERQQAREDITESMTARSIEGLPEVSGTLNQNRILAQRIQSIREEQERLATAMCLRELQTRRIQGLNNVTISGVQDPRLAYEIGLADIFNQENLRRARALYSNDNQAILNRGLTMLQHQIHQQRMIQPTAMTGLSRGTSEEMMRIREAQSANVGAALLPESILRAVTHGEMMRFREAQALAVVTTLPQSRINDQQQAPIEQLIQPTGVAGVSRDAIEERNRAVLNQGLSVLQQQARRERMIQPTALTGLSLEATEELRRIREAHLEVAGAALLQSRNPNQGSYQQQAHQGQLVHPSHPVGVSSQDIAEQLIRIRMRRAEIAAAGATMLQSMRIREAQAAATGALLPQSRNHNQQQPYQEGTNQSNAPSEQNSSAGASANGRKK